jgi:RHS repeat-associated protein
MLDPSAGSVEYSYDRAGNRLTLTTSVGTTHYRYDAAQQLIEVIDSTGGTTTLAYHPNGQRARLAFPNGIMTTYTYNDVDRLTDIVQTNALGDILNSYQYTFDPVGNRTSVRYDDGSGLNWNYDDANRLIRETTLDTTGGRIQDVAYAYDPVGNIIEKTTNGNAVSYTYNELDQLQIAGTTEYRYDARGNLIEVQDGADVRSFTWDAANRLVAATYSDGMSATYQYDWQGRRVMKQGDTDSTHYLWDIASQYGDVVAEFDSSGAPLVEYVLAGQSLIGEVRGSNASYLLTDGQGSIRTVTSNTGTVTNEYSYEAYGSLLASTGTTPNSYLYTAQQFDTETGLYSLRARYYDPAAGRFLSRDTAPFEMSDPVAINRYVYAAANPIAYQDPTGYMETTLEWGMTVQISASQVIAVVAAFGYAVGCLYVKSATAVAALARDRATLLMIEILYPSPTICHWSIMIYPGPATPTVSQHMIDAGVLGPHGIIFEREANPLNVIRNRRAACSPVRRRLHGITGSCDEYPFASTTAGGANSSIRGVPLWENWVQGGYIGSFYLWKVIPSPYNEFVVVVIP